MTFEQLLAKAREKAKGYDPTGVDFLAVQFNITGEGSGVLYIEIKDGRINIEPYEYYDRSCAITTSGENFDKMIDGKLDSVAAFFAGKLKIEGSVDKALQFSNLVNRK